MPELPGLAECAEQRSASDEQHAADPNLDREVEHDRDARGDAAPRLGQAGERRVVPGYERHVPERRGHHPGEIDVAPPKRCALHEPFADDGAGDREGNRRGAVADESMEILERPADHPKRGLGLSGAPAVSLRDPTPAKLHGGSTPAGVRDLRGEPTGPSGWATSRPDGRPRLPVSAGATSARSARSRNRATISEAEPLRRPSARATSARGMPGCSWLSRSTASAPAARRSAAAPRCGVPLTIRYNTRVTSKSRTDG